MDEDDDGNDLLLLLRRNQDDGLDIILHFFLTGCFSVINGFDRASSNGDVVVLQSE